MKALVTGASSGIGRAFATTLAAQGYAVTAVARGAEALDALMVELGPGHDCLVADLTAAEGLAATAELLRGGDYTLLVNNAGTATHGELTQASLESALTTVDLNCRAVVVLAHAFLAAAGPGSALVNVSSTLGFTPKPGLGVYCATKAFVTAFSETLWYEQKPRGVQVLALCPGVTRTASQRADGVPSWLVQTPSAVVARARKALSDRAGPVVLTSRINRLLTTALRLVPRKAALAVLAE
ncbi:SDR family NAD(P)-dependent oxidoreductase [Nocardia vermiculata]|uniref:SDR family NAD(P)-dependent oxidoreductase n=1 Tax=Nocardia vermiculata TaxID=257274 RepID=A0A846YC85_9NOCA|nr:SDR family NAD(P)-dependent oxidoreductase [Nocardia vermiculata]NKY54409.1 SDR family NAD(P)-dependent oxidoreductase [Nocardia vermiculata]